MGRNRRRRTCSKPASKRVRKPAIAALTGVGWPLPERRRRSARSRCLRAWYICPGRTRKHSISEAISTATTVTGISLAIDPRRPGRKYSTPKATMVVVAAATTGPIMRLAPMIAPWRLAALLVRQEISVLPHHNGIINDDPQRQDQRKQREHVDRQAQRPHDPQRRGDRHRNANRDPEGGAHIEEQEQEGEHNQYAVERVIAQQQHPAEDEVGADVVVLDGDVGGKGRPGSLRVLADHGLLADGITVGPRRICSEIAGSP